MITIHLSHKVIIIAIYSKLIFPKDKNYDYTDGAFSLNLSSIYFIFYLVFEIKVRLKVVFIFRL